MRAQHKMKTQAPCSKSMKNSEMTTVEPFQEQSPAPLSIKLAPEGTRVGRGSTKPQGWRNSQQATGVGGLETARAVTLRRSRHGPRWRTRL